MAKERRATFRRLEQDQTRRVSRRLARSGEERGRLAHDDLSVYNAVQRAAYLVAIVDLIVLVLSGLTIWKSVQFPHLRELMGGYDNARLVHFVAMALLLAFTAVHLVMVAIVPRTLVGMLTGRVANSGGMP